MQLQREAIASVHPLLNNLLMDYFARTKAKVGLPPLRMNWPAYVALGKQGSLVVFTARRPDHKVVGFVMYHLYQHLHHDVKCAACDILAVDVDERGKGIGRALVEFAEPVLRAREVKIVTHQVRTIYDAEPLFPKLGYSLVELGYMKEIG